MNEIMQASNFVEDVQEKMNHDHESDKHSESERESEYETVETREKNERLSKENEKSHRNRYNSFTILQNVHIKLYWT